MFIAEILIAVFACIVAGLLAARYVFGVQPATIGARAGRLVRPAAPFVRRHRKKFILLVLILAPFMAAGALLVVALVAVAHVLRHVVDAVDADDPDFTDDEHEDYLDGTYEYEDYDVITGESVLIRVDGQTGKETIIG